jgi:hypothetical protein
MSLVVVALVPFDEHTFAFEETPASPPLKVDVVTIVTTPFLIETTRSMVSSSAGSSVIVSGGDTRTSHRPAAHAAVSVLTGEALGEVGDALGVVGEAFGKALDVTGAALGVPRLIGSVEGGPAALEPQAATASVAAPHRLIMTVRLMSRIETDLRGTGPERLDRTRRSNG